MIHQTGYRPDLPKLAGQKPDHSAAMRLGAAPIPKSADNRHLIINILDQGAMSSCVANAVCQAVRAAQMRASGKTVPLGSRLFTYFMARSYHNEQNFDQGTFIRFAFAALNKFGVPPESSFPYTDQGEPWKRMPPSNAFRLAFDQSSNVGVTTYMRIEETGYARVDAVKRALAQRFLVVFGTSVSDKFVSNDLGNGVVGPPVGLSIAGGHAMTLVGYDGDVFDVVNSWGAAWGDLGFFKMTADWVAHSMSSDFWICETTPPFAEGAS